MKQQLIHFIKCVECGKQAEKKFANQVTCLSNACRQLRKTHLLGYRLKTYSKPCIVCEKPFETKFSRKKYCSKECFKKIRKIQHRHYTREQTRQEKGVYEKWASELRKVGYVIIEPTGRKKL